MARDLARRTQFHVPDPRRPLLDVQGATVEYGGHGFGRTRAFRAVDDVSFAIEAGRSLGLVGESGCGKTTLGRAILGLAPLTRGAISIAAPASGSSRRFAARLARSAQMVFQDPYASLDPRQKILSAVAEPMTVHGIGPATDRATRARQLLERVGIDAQFADAYPHQLSGGQRQRVCIARALAVAPQLIICDEPTSALDVSIQAQVVELLRDLQQHEGLTYLFITHDLALLPQLVQDVAVMYLGRIVERGPVGDVLRHPSHPYTTSLLAAAPVLGQRRTANRRFVVGEATGAAPAAGCAFRPRCWLYPDLDDAARSRCEREVPLLAEGGAPGRCLACHHADGAAVTVSRRASTRIANVDLPDASIPFPPASDSLVGAAHDCHANKE